MEMQYVRFKDELNLSSKHMHFRNWASRKNDGHNNNRTKLNVEIR